MILTQHEDVAGALANLGARDIESLDEYGILADWPENSEDCICKEMASIFGGQWFPGAEHISWGQGGRKRGITILHPIALQEALEARQVASGLGVDCWSWNIGNASRRLLEWLGPLPPSLARVANIEAIDFKPMAYSHCQPGLYDWLSMWDIDHAYWQFTRRLPGILCAISPDGSPRWMKMPADLRERWKDLQESVQTCKPLRLRMHGSMIGVRQTYDYYCKAGKRQTAPIWGPYANAALIAKRGVYEVTMLQGAKAPYANTDCIALPGTERPAVWERYGIKFKLEHEGSSVLAGVGAYRVGSYETLNFSGMQQLVRRGMRFYNEPMPAPERRLIDEWWV